MKTKKSGVFAALAVVLLLTAALVTNCMDPTILGGGPGGSGDSGVSQGKNPGFQPPPGKGLIFLSFEAPGTSSGRTIRPDISSYTSVSSFTLFDVYWIDNVYDEDEVDTDSPAFTDNSGQRLNIASADLANTPLALVGGKNYEIHVFAYTTGTSGNKAQAVAFGAATGFPVTGASQTANIDLKEIASNTHSGTGTFEWTLTQPGTDAATTTSMDILILPGGTTSALTNPITTLTGTQTLNAGYYRVEITLQRTNGAEVKVREVLHIYQGMTSTYEPTLPPVNNNVYTITYTFNDGRATGTTEDETVTHGDELAGPAINPPVHTGGSSWEFLGWWTTASGTGSRRITTDEAGNPSPGPAYKAIRTETLQARWQSNGVTIEIAVTMDGVNSPQLNITGLTDWDWDSDTNTGTASANRNSPPTNVQISVSNSSAYSAYTWKHGTSTLLDGQTGSSVTLDFSDIRLQLAGTHTITVEATGTGGGAPYLSTVTITVTGD